MNSGISGFDLYGISAFRFAVQRALYGVVYKENNYTASAVVIPAGASVSVETDNDNFGWGCEVILTFTAENAEN